MNYPFKYKKYRMKDSELLSRLRAETRTAHQAIDATPLLMRIRNKQMRESDIIAYLSFSFHLQSSICKASVPVSFPSWSKMDHKNNIEALYIDLKTLSPTWAESADQIDHLVHTLESVNPTSVAYVVGGMEMGKLMIVQGVKRSPLTGSLQLTSFDTDKSQTSERWKLLLKEIDTSLNESNLDEICQDAIYLFSCFSKILKQL